jgi:imidazolonepropionase
VEVKSGYGLEADTELRMLRAARALDGRVPVTIRTTCLAAHAVPPEYAGRADAYTDLICGKIIPAVADQGLADAVDAFCEHIGFSAAQVARVFDAAAEAGLAVKLHADQLSDTGGAALAARYGALSADHLEYTSATGVEAMAGAGSVAVLLPGAFHVLGETQRPPVESFRQAGVPMALATDSNPGSSPVLSLRLMMSMACTLFGLTAEESLQAVTCNAAKALGIEDRCGALQAGKQADLAVWRIDHPAELCYWFGGDLCRAVFRHGVLTHGAV